MPASGLDPWRIAQPNRTEWVLKHDSGCGLAAAQPSLNYVAQQVNGPWILENTNRREGDNIEAPAEQESEWNSDDEDVLNNQDRGFFLVTTKIGLKTTSIKMFTSLGSILTKKLSSCI